MTDFLFFLIPFLIVVALMPPACRRAMKARFVDRPDERKTHKKLVPPIGGLIIFPVYMLSLLLQGGDLFVLWPLFAALLLLLGLGAVDDYRGVRPWTKFALQSAAALIVVLCGEAHVYYLGDLFGWGDNGLGWISVPFSLAAVVLLINAINLMDGLDGLAGGFGFIAIFWILVASVLAGQPEKAVYLLPLLGALAGFLFYNMRHPFRRQAVVFLGDSGSMALGLVLAWVCIDYAQDPRPVVAPISVAWILALPIMDVCAQFYRRVREGNHPFQPDRGHFHHNVMDSGASPGEAAALILSLSFMLGAIGYGGWFLGVPIPILTGAWVFLILAHMHLSARPEVYTGAIKNIRAFFRKPFCG
ncbi:MAG: undecaprenyl/decaprenyl-phosphate alpha-N-acetylglucosaminyl 1-phosphate transferase [Alphaproteobacteria bacterium]|nr:undecaprenyl/decaprenyl-phosphate alpha-N-acetylglucosaminyl 1-phosphate transferase [Alphaproteobacteria bacterium]